MSITKEKLSLFTCNDLFIETGTNHGRCVAVALELGFKNIISIEIDKNLYEEACKRFKDNLNVRLIRGDSAQELSSVLDSINQPATIYLDAHKFDENNQIWAELEAIKNNYIKGTVILIDDMEMLFSDSEMYDVIKKLIEIDKEFRTYCIDGAKCNHHSVPISNDILVAETGSVFNAN